VVGSVRARRGGATFSVVEIEGGSVVEIKGGSHD